MSVERINIESSADRAATSIEPKAMVSFRAPLPKDEIVEGSPEQKSRRNRKKRKKELSRTVSEQFGATKKLAEKPAYTIWERPEDSPQVRQSAEFGKKVLDVAKQPQEMSVAQQEKPILEWSQQPMIQHQGRPIEQLYEPVQPPTQPPDPTSYRRSFWKEQSAFPETSHGENGGMLPPLHDYEQLEQEPSYNSRQTHHIEAPADVPAGSSAKRYESDIAPGYQRSTVDVSRAAWTGALVGWWVGRRGKRKAIERAQKAGVKRGVGSVKQQPPLRQRRSTGPSVQPRLEAEPMHDYYNSERGRTVVQPLSVETHASRRVPELAAIAVFDRATNRSALERIDVPRPARIAASKAAESVITRLPEAVAGAGSERQLGKRELMRLSKDIKVDGVSLKEVFKAKRIDEPGLRAVVETYLRGGDVRQQLTEEIVVKEQSYELDPVIRKQHLRGERPRQSGSGSRFGAGSGGIGQTIGHALGGVASSTETTARSAGRAIASGAKTAQRDIIDNSNTTDWLSVTAVVVLYSIILILLLT